MNPRTTCQTSQAATAFVDTDWRRPAIATAAATDSAAATVSWSFASPIAAATPPPRTSSAASMIVVPGSGMDVVQRYEYTGRELASEASGYYFFRFRVYGPDLGQFVTRDPLGNVDGMGLYGGYFAATVGVDPSGRGELTIAPNTRHEFGRKTKGVVTPALQANEAEHPTIECKGTLTVDAFAQGTPKMKAPELPLDIQTELTAIGYKSRYKIAGPFNIVAKFKWDLLTVQEQEVCHCPDVGFFQEVKSVDLAGNSTDWRVDNSQSKTSQWYGGLPAAPMMWDNPGWYRSFDARTKLMTAKRVEGQRNLQPDKTLLQFEWGWKNVEPQGSFVDEWGIEVENRAVVNPYLRKLD